MLALIVKPGAWDLVVEATFWGEILKAVATAVAILLMKLFTVCLLTVAMPTCLCSNYTSNFNRTKNIPLLIFS